MSKFNLFILLLAIFGFSSSTFAMGWRDHHGPYGIRVRMMYSPVHGCAEALLGAPIKETRDTHQAFRDYEKSIFKRVGIDADINLAEPIEKPGTKILEIWVDGVQQANEMAAFFRAHGLIDYKGRPTREGDLFRFVFPPYGGAEMVYQAQFAKSAEITVTRPWGYDFEVEQLLKEHKFVGFEKKTSEEQGTVFKLNLTKDQAANLQERLKGKAIVQFK